MRKNRGKCREPEHETVDDEQVELTFRIVQEHRDIGICKQTIVCPVNHLIQQLKY